jgi:hypothetical protein
VSQTRFQPGTSSYTLYTKIYVISMQSDFYLLGHNAVQSVERQLTFSGKHVTIRQIRNKHKASSKQNWFLAWLILWPWIWRRHVPQKRQLNCNGLYAFMWRQEGLHNRRSENLTLHNISTKCYSTRFSNVIYLMKHEKKSQRASLRCHTFTIV